VWLAALLFTASSAADAHERFIPHTPTALLQEGFFQSLNPDMLTIGLRGAFVMAMLMALWLVRQPLAAYIEQKPLRNLPGRPKQLLRLLVAFLLDQPVAHPWFSAVGEWARVFCLRCLALVLIFSANRQALVTPSYPLEPATLGLFQWVQVVLAAGILTQTLWRAWIAVVSSTHTRASPSGASSWACSYRSSTGTAFSTHGGSADCCQAWELQGLI
jgi:hypothetical protein